MSNSAIGRQCIASGTLVLGLFALMAGCSPAPGVDKASELAQAKTRIAALEAELAKLKASSMKPLTGALGDASSVPTATTAAATEVMAAVQEAARAARTAPAPSAPLEQAGRQWNYLVTEEPMSSKMSHRAYVVSSNVVSLNFPYTGVQHGTLAVRNHPSYGRDVVFNIESGQLLCPSYSGCSVKVRFDDHAPAGYSANGPSDHSTEVLFLANYNGFLAQLKKAKRVRIAVELYQNGIQVFDFDVSGFDSAKYEGRR